MAFNTNDSSASLSDDQFNELTGVVTAPTQVRTILGADFGSVNTRVVFINQVDGQYRLISRATTFTTADPPYGDVTIGLIRALDQITTLIGRPFLSANQIVIGNATATYGADQFFATSSGGRPMRVVMVGLMPDVSLNSGRNALGSIYIELVDVLSIGDLRSDEEQVNALLTERPDLIFIVGGTDQGARETMLALLKVVQLAISLLPAGSRPVIVYAGNEALIPDVKGMLESEIELFTAPNVRPALEVERLAGAQMELAVAYGAYKANAGGYRDLLMLSRPLGVLPTATCYTNVIRYMGELPGTTGVLSIDVGSSTVTLCASIKKQPYVSIRSDLGLGHSARSALELVGTKAISQWLTYKISPDEITNYILNKTLRPASVPATVREMELEFALTREIIRLALIEAREGWRDIPRGVILPPVDPIIGAGAVLTQAADPGVTAMVLLDALQPLGTVRLKSDPYGVIATLGAAAYLTPLATVQVLEAGGLLDLGTAICPEGSTREGDAMTAHIVYPDGRTLDKIIPKDSIRLVDLPAGQTARVTLKLARGLTLNGKRQVTLEMTGGAAGLIFDTRGRPLTLPTDFAKRAESLKKWMMGARNGLALPEVGSDEPQVDDTLDLTPVGSGEVGNVFYDEQ
jgi:hypothetical protein